MFASASRQDSLAIQQEVSDRKLADVKVKRNMDGATVSFDMIQLKVNSITVIYVLAAIARLLYAGEGTMAHYTIHSDIPVSYFLSAGVGIVVAIALLLPLSRKLSLLFIGISAVSGLIGFAEMAWIYMTEGETNPVTAPLVGAIVFSALLYLKPTLTGKG
jgi:hypothetical protein